MDGQEAGDSASSSRDKEGNPPPAPAQDGKAGFSIRRVSAMALGVLCWSMVRERVVYEGGLGYAIEGAFGLALIPTLAWFAGYVYLTVSSPTGRAIDVLAALIAFSIVWCLHYGIFHLSQPLLGDAGPWMLAALLSLLWATLYGRRVRGLAGPAGKWSHVLLRGTDFLEILAAILLIGAWNAIWPTWEPRRPVRSYVSELILATSSAKTALSEGMRSYGTWSPSWVSAITINAGGMVVSGTAPTSFSVVTMIPTVTTDNRLVWTCTGTPAKYMPASCRQ